MKQKLDIASPFLNKKVRELGIPVFDQRVRKATWEIYFPSRNTQLI